jgi:hypothetical protein
MVSKGDQLVCEQCGIVCTVDDLCGCVECDLICCDQPMKNIRKEERTIFHTGNTCSESAVYKCQTCGTQEIPLSKGETFPPCSTCKKGGEWKMVRSLA